MRLSYLSILYITGVMLILRPESGDAAGTRAKRVVAFRKGSTFFYRLNYKVASLASTTIFAQATGFKVTWKLPSSDMEKRKRRNVDEFHESVELVYESHGFDGKACLAKNICQAMDYLEGKEGAIAKILKLLAKRTNENPSMASLDKIACQNHVTRCPLELVGIHSLIDNIN